jgi:hypothetical protein
MVWTRSNTENQALQCRFRYHDMNASVPWIPNLG